MMQSKIFSLILLIALTVLVYCLYQFADLDLDHDKPDVNMPDLTAFNVKSVWFDLTGKPAYKLASSALYHYQQNDIIVGHSNVFEYETEAQPKLTVSSLRAKFIRGADQIFTYGKTKLIREKTADQAKWVIDTSDVFIELADETARSSSPTLVVTDGSTLHGGGFYLDYKNSLLKFYKGVRVAYVKTPN